MADHTVSGPDEKPERRRTRPFLPPDAGSDPPRAVALPWRKDSENELRRLLAHALPDVDLEHALRDRPDSEQAAVASLAYSMAEGVNRQLDALGLLLSVASDIDADTLQTVGFLIRNLTQHQEVALELGALANDARTRRSERSLKRPRGAGPRKHRPRPASGRRAS